MSEVGTRVIKADREWYVKLLELLEPEERWTTENGIVLQTPTGKFLNFQSE